MKYRIYVSGMFIGVETLTPEEVKKYNDSEITVVRNK
nr:MAG TPA: hypothetical protein [Caudoviricetes sp.]